MVRVSCVFHWVLVFGFSYGWLRKEDPIQQLQNRLRVCDEQIVVERLFMDKCLFVKTTIKVSVTIRPAFCIALWAHFSISGGKISRTASDCFIP
jgi:hypothetical protein